MACEGEKKGE